MGQGESDRRRRGPPKTKKTRNPPVEEYPEEVEDEAEWYQDVVDDSGDSGGFGGFAVKRPQMSNNDPAESEQWERYFEKQYHGKSKQKRESIEESNRRSSHVKKLSQPLTVQQNRLWFPSAMLRRRRCRHRSLNQKRRRQTSHS